jgi:hypothetical protein
MSLRFDPDEFGPENWETVEFLERTNISPSSLDYAPGTNTLVMLADWAGYGYFLAYEAWRAKHERS